MKNKMTLGKVIDELLLCYERACNRPDIHKKWAWALYHTWIWCDEEEEIKLPKEDGDLQKMEWECEA